MHFVDAVEDEGQIEDLELAHPSGPNLASEGASICTAPSCRASSSSLSLYSVLLG
jgi:hypothetical protein